MFLTGTMCCIVVSKTFDPKTQLNLNFLLVLVLTAQSCLTLCDPMDCSPPGSSVHGDSPSKNTGVGCHALLQGIVLTQGLNLGLLHHRRILCRLSPQGSLSSFSSLPPSPHKFPLGCWTGRNYMPLNTPQVIAKSLFMTVLPSLMDFL